MSHDPRVSIPSRMLIPLEDTVSALIQARRSSGTSQDALAARVGHTRKWVSEFERGIYTPTLKRLIKHAEALDLDVRIVLLPKEAES